MLPCVTICVWMLCTGWNIREEEIRLLQTDKTEMLLLFMAWWTGLIDGCSHKADRLKGGIWSPFLFCFHQTSYLWVSWVESSRRRNVKEGGDMQCCCRLSQILSYAWPTLAATGCHSKLFAWNFGLFIRLNAQVIVQFVGVTAFKCSHDSLSAHSA